MNQTVSVEGISISIERDVCYGHGSIGYGTNSPATRPLLMDVYLPIGDAPSGGYPTLVLSHGGAFHRGAKDCDEFEQGEFHNTPVHEYCERFAAKGYVCFSIGYRLTQELPSPLQRPIKRNRDTVERGRIDYVRELLHLPPATNEELLRGAEAAFTDVANAYSFIQSNAFRWGVDVERMAIGGFSAGAFASAYAVFAMGHRAAGVICLSGGMDLPDAEYYVHGAHGQPPVLLFAGEHDLPSIPTRVAALASNVANAGLGLRRYMVPDKPHFYDRESRVVLEQATLLGGEHCKTVEEAIEQFLNDTLKFPEVTTEVLEEFAQSWNEHDINKLMGFMTDDCVFHTWSGSGSVGTRHIGHLAVRDAFVKAWTDFPDAQWTRARHFVAGTRGVSEWTFTGTRASDGQRVEVDGCDIFTFSGKKIRVKDSWRKSRQ